MTRSLLAFCFAFTSVSVSLAQIDFRSGFIVRNSGDTTMGRIAYRSDAKNQKEVFFKTTKRGRAERFEPGEVKAYGIFDGNHYESIQLPVDSPIKGVGFVRALAKGNLQLFGYDDFYMVFDGTSWTTLPRPKEMEIKGPDKVMVVRDQHYRSLLDSKMDDCIDKNVNFRFSEAEITNRVLTYNKCKDSTLNDRKLETAIKVNYKFFGGYQLSQLDYDFVRKISFPNRTVTGGLGFEFSLPRKTDKIFFTIDAMYSKALYQGYLEYQEADLIRADVILDVTNIKIPFGFKYVLHGGRWAPYVELGGSWSGLIASENRLIRERQSLNEIYRTEFLNLYPTKNIKGFWLGLGLHAPLGKSAKFFTEVRLDAGEGYLGSAVENDSKLKSATILCGLRF